VIQRRLFATVGLLLVGGCAAVPQQSSVRAPTLQAPGYSTVGLERVLQHDAQALERLFGQPQLDVREGSARKLQFGGACVLDAYLYPPSRGGTPTVTHIDARQTDGRPADRAGCISALAAGHAR